MSEEFREFFEENSKYGGFRDNISFFELYDWLSMAEQVKDMMDACKFGRPALEGVVEKLEDKFGDRNDLDITQNFVKQMIGAAVKHILKPFGYLQTIQKAMPKGKYFTSATHYKFEEKAFITKVLKLRATIQSK